jgi:hypothetical protein
MPFLTFRFAAVPPQTETISSSILNLKFAPVLRL